MNTPKYNIEHEIKKQIEEREITPTRDLGTEIESQTSAKTSVKTRINWFLVAACLGLLLSLGVVLVNSSDEEVDQPQIVETTIQRTLAQPENKIGKESTPLLVEHNEAALNKINAVISTQQTKIIDPEVIVVQKQVPAIKQKEIIPPIAPDQFSNSIAIIDSAKVPVKRKRFVDPSTLLFSVEHKDVIEKSKDGSNVATIDLNSK